MKNTTLKLFGLELPIQRWALPLVTLIAVAGLAAFVFQHIFPPDDLRQTNEHLEATVREYGLHMTDMPTSVHVDPDGAFTIKVFADRCVLIQRKVSGQILTKLVLDLERAAALQQGQVVPPAAPIRPLFDLPVVEAQGGRCLNPHPGSFTVKDGPRNGCWVQVFRYFSDGCSHYQLFESCRGYWDSNPDGSPKVVWTRCVH